MNVYLAGDTMGTPDSALSLLTEVAMKAHLEVHGT